VNFLLLLIVFGGIAFKMMSPADRARHLATALDFTRQVKATIAQPRPLYEAFKDALRARSRHLVVTPALVMINAAVFGAMLVGVSAIADPDTLLGWGASIGTRTTNGEWWRLVTSVFVHTGLFQFIVTMAVLAQLGAVLERLVGRAAFGAVYLSAGVFTGLIHLSSHPVVVTVSSAGAVFGLYGLLLATLTWQIFRQTLRRRTSNAEPGTEETTDAGVTIPPTAIKRLGYGALLFLLWSAVNGLAGAGEVIGLAVGFGYGTIVARRASIRSPEMREVGGVSAAALVIAIACAVPLRNISDVTPEITRVVATEERTTTAYQAAFNAFKKGRLSAEALAQLAERKIVPELQAVDARLTALKNVPPEHQAVVTDAHEYLRLRSNAWRYKADVIRRTNAAPLRSPERSMEASWRIEAQTLFRANQMAMGNAEGAERASLEAFQRVRQAAPPVAGVAAVATGLAADLR
jgi:membrane associated rhomboid family serine protease